jgi:hypothetical protein
MSNELKLLADNYKLDQIYQNNLFTIKSICELLGVWNNYTPEQKFQLENFTKRDSNINKHFDFKGTYNLNYVYGELLRDSVETVIEKINRYKKISEKDVFVDIGSGAGKLVLHLAIKSDIKTLVGVEIVPQRNRYSKWIKEKIVHDKSIFFIEKDVRDFDLSIATIIFMNNICFDTNLIKDIYNRIPKGCNFISAVEIPECKILKEEFLVSTSWTSKLKLFYYIK